MAVRRLEVAWEKFRADCQAYGSSGWYPLFMAGDESLCLSFTAKDAKAFWIGPDGDILPVHGSHIGEVIRDPARFGMSRAEIEVAYAHHKEPLGLEGQARECIIRYLVTRGWIRVRLYRAHISVQVFTMSDAMTKERLKTLLRCPSWTGDSKIRVASQKENTVVVVTLTELEESLRDGYG
jgi:hypothetical protein